MHPFHVGLPDSPPVRGGIPAACTQPCVLEVNELRIQVQKVAVNEDLHLEGFLK